MALSVSSLFTESQLQYPTGSEEHRRVDAARRRSSARAGHVPQPFWHRWPRLNPPRACPTSSPARFSFSFAFSACLQLRSSSRSNSDELALARHRKNAHYIFITAPPCSPLPPPPLGCTDWVSVRAHWPFLRHRFHGRTSPERTSPRPTTTEPFSSSFLCVVSSVVTPCSSYQAR